jgi:hypothetical protein
MFRDFALRTETCSADFFCVFPLIEFTWTTSVLHFWIGACVDFHAHSLGLFTQPTTQLAERDDVVSLGRELHNQKSGAETPATGIQSTSSYTIPVSSCECFGGRQAGQLSFASSRSYSDQGLYGELSHTRPPGNRISCTCCSSTQDMLLLSQRIFFVLWLGVEAAD